MPDIALLWQELNHGSPPIAHKALLALMEFSRQSDALYPLMPQFAAMLDSPSSYVRVRGFSLMIANARYDDSGMLDGLLAPLLSHIVDPKPAASRQLIGLLPALAQAKPQYRAQIRHALEHADLSGYPDSMRGLVAKDIAAALRAL